MDILMQLLRVLLVISLRKRLLTLRIVEKAFSYSAVSIGRVRQTSANLENLGKEQ